MSKFYDGPIQLKEFKAEIKVEGSRANIDSQYKMVNPTTKTHLVKASSEKFGMKEIIFRGPVAPRTIPRFEPFSEPILVRKIEKSKRIGPGETFFVDTIQSVDIIGEKTKILKYIPDIDLENESVAKKVRNFEITVELPPEAKKVVSSSPVASRVEVRDNKLVCHYSMSDYYLLPVFLKWTELDVNLQVTKKVVQNRNNTFTVSIIIVNGSSAKVENINLIDDFSSLEVEPFGAQANIKKVIPFDRSTRIKYDVSFSLNPSERKTFRYTLKQLIHNLQIPSTNIFMGEDLIAVGVINAQLKIPLPFPPPKCAFVLPSGWSFDFLNGGDHHLNEIGIMCMGNSYNTVSEKLSWTTNAVFADKNFDDDYRWSVNHQIARFNPGFAYNGATPWLAKIGNTSVHKGIFKHNDLKRFSKATVLLQGWRFDFTSGDHHINRISLKISNITFNKSIGEVKWKTSVIYADKNFDDNYRYLYQYVILGFDGEIIYTSYSGSDNGGSTAHNGVVQNNNLKNYNNAMVIPMGWNFDFKSDDHHINEHSFNILNVSYNKSAGQVNWLANLKYADKNFDDDYYWGYHVAVIATNSGESRSLHRGPYTDDGGFDTRNYLEDLNGVFKPITWNNGICDGDETGVDCGGSSPAVNMNCISDINPGNADSSGLFSLKSPSSRLVVVSYANSALMEYAYEMGEDFNTFYAGVTKPDKYVEAVAAFVHNHMEYVSDGLFGGAQSAIETLTDTGHRGPGDFNGDCEDHAILRASLLRALGFSKDCIFCADHHNSKDQGQDDECRGDKKGSGGHTFNVVNYKGKYRILDYEYMQNLFWANKQAWNQHVVDNIWNDHTGKHWSRQDVSPFGSSSPLVNYPGNPSCPSSNWDWRTYFCDVTL
ncbi:MAG: transglutaminase-like domain-containing protein [Bacteroidales bacterium]|nr:transglutaminase-like domain-containing protein [Bacteroidales bacterium]